MIYLPTILLILGLLIVIFLLILGGVYVVQRMITIVDRHQMRARHENRKLLATQDFEYDAFYGELHNPKKALPPIQAVAVNPPVVDRCFEDDEDAIEVYP